MLPSSQHFGGRGVCWSSKMGLGRVKSINYSHRPAQNQTQGGQCIVALLVLRQATGKLGFTRFTIARTWGKPPPSPLQYTLCFSTSPTSKWHFVPRLPNESLEIPKVGTFTTLGPHNFMCKPPIEMMFEAALQPLLSTFQRHVARHLHARKSGRFSTFNGRQSNYQFNSRPFFWP